MDALEGHMLKSRRDDVWLLMWMTMHVFSAKEKKKGEKKKEKKESHMQNEQFNSDRQAVDRFGSKVFLFWFFFLVIVNSFVYVTH